ELTLQQLKILRSAQIRILLDLNRSSLRLSESCCSKPRWAAVAAPGRACSACSRSSDIRSRGKSVRFGSSAQETHHRSFQKSEGVPAVFGGDIKKSRELRVFKIKVFQTKDLRGRPGDRT
ncbi:MAG: hypothetical protein AAFY60_19745, partial [Myxococcota bacterium]